jgi:hypothetical protein
MQKKADCVALRAACDKRLEEMTADMRLIKSALVGTDLRGGLVNQVNTLNTRLSDIIATQELTDSTRNKEKEKADSSAQSAKTSRADVVARYKIALIGVAGGLFGILLGFILSKF